MTKRLPKEIKDGVWKMWRVDGAEMSAGDVIQLARDHGFGGKGIGSASLFIRNYYEQVESFDPNSENRFVNSQKHTPHIGDES